MDTRQILTFLLIFVVLMFLVPYLFNRGGGTTAAPYPLYSMPGGKQDSEGGAKPEAVVLGKDAHNRITGKVAITVDNVTAGVDLVELNPRDYPAKIGADDPLVILQAADNAPKPFATLVARVQLASDNFEMRPNLYESRYIWMIEDKKVADGVVTAVTLRMTLTSRSGVPAAEFRKTFELTPDSYEIKITHSIKSLSDQPLKAAVDQLASTELSRDNPQFDDRLFQAATLRAAARTVDGGKFSAMHAELAKFADTETAAEVDAYVTLPVPASPAGNPSGTITKVGDGSLTLKAADASHTMALTNTTVVTVDGKPGSPADLKSDMKAVTVVHHGTRWIGQLYDFKTGSAVWLQDPVLWVAASNRFFAAITRPLPTVPADPKATPVTLDDGRGTTIPQDVHVAAANIDVTHCEIDPNLNGGVIRLTGALVEVAPRATVQLPLSVYLGPKKPEILKGDINATPGSLPQAYSVYQYDKIINYSRGGPCGWMTLPWLVEAILWLFGFLVRTVAFGNYGVAIMVLVIVVRAALHPLTRASQVNMAVMGKKMKDLQPKLDAIKKKYGDPKQKQKLNEEMMRLYRENNVNPAGSLMGCLPMFLQMPIWIALYSGLGADIALRHAPFIHGWINDLSSPDTVWPSPVRAVGHPYFTIPWFHIEIYGLNLLPILLTAVFFIQMKVSTASQPKPADPQQAQMAKISQYMIFIFPLFLYGAPSGLNLYIFASTMGGLVDTYFVRKTLKKRGILPTTAAALPTHEEP